MRRSIAQFAVEGPVVLADLYDATGVFPTAAPPGTTFRHSWGSVAGLITSLIEAGFDILNPVQCSATGMEQRFYPLFISSNPNEKRWRS
ncbi:MAG: hypothetical protein ACLPLR_00040 [Terriglobales bacterium]